MSLLRKTNTRNEKLILAGNSAIEVYDVFSSKLIFKQTIVDKMEWGIGSMLIHNNRDLFVMNGDSDKICKYRFKNDNDLEIQLLFESTQKFSWPLLRCFCVYNDKYGNSFLVGILNADNFKHILIEKIYDNHVTGDFKIFKDIHKKTISNIIYNPLFDYFISGGRDCSLQIWKLKSEKVYGYKGMQIN